MEDEISELRTFNRFFTQSAGLLNARFMESEMSLPEARLLFEVARADAPVASELQALLGMDPAYVSRVLVRFEERGWIRRGRGETDARRRPIELTSAGRAAFDDVDARQRSAVEDRLRALRPAQRRELVRSLRTARLLLDGPREPDVIIRTFRTGDLGIVASRQSRFYSETFGWNAKLIETSEMEITTAFLRDFKPGREQCWIAEVDGETAGSVFLVDEGGGTARLRLFFVEPFARGLGIGGSLVSTCVDFAREAGHARIVLWTHTILDSARRIYAGHGFVLTDTEVHDRLGPTMQSETWELDLAVPS